MPEGGTNRAESPQNVSTNGRIIHVGPEEEEALPYNTSQRANVIITLGCSQEENEIPIQVPPPGICQIHIMPSSCDSPLVHALIHAALHCIRTTSSATPNGAFFEEDVANIKEVLSLASQLRHPDCGPDPDTSHLMEQLWSDFVSYSAMIPSELSFATCCLRSRAAPLPICKTPSLSQPYQYPKTLQTHPLLDQFP